MKAALYSDLHLELYPYLPQLLPVDLVILASDITTEPK